MTEQHLSIKMRPRIHNSQERIYSEVDLLKYYKIYHTNKQLWNWMDSNNTKHIWDLFQDPFFPDILPHQPKAIYSITQTQLTICEIHIMYSHLIDPYFPRNGQNQPNVFSHRLFMGTKIDERQSTWTLWLVCCPTVLSLTHSPWLGK